MYNNNENLHDKDTNGMPFWLLGEPAYPPEIIGTIKASGDLISRKEAIEAIDAYLGLSEVNRTVQNMTSLQDILKNLPSVEPEIIRCENCLHWDKFPSCSAFPEYHECHAPGSHTATTAEDYCSRAERREEIADNNQI